MFHVAKRHTGNMYALLLKLLFLFPAEQIHNVSFGLLRIIGIFRPLRHLFGFLLSPKNPVLHQKLAGLNFPGPMGLAPGFDKNAHGINTWGALGFGFAEVGTITSQAQPGNPQPRLFRIPEDKALFNRMGFNNHGAGPAAAALRTRRQDRYTIPIGVNIGKTKVVDNQYAAQDYRQTTRLVYPFADFIVINVSSPNTPGLRDLQTVQALLPIIEQLQEETANQTPLFLKIAPDLANEDIISLTHLAIDKKIAGIIATNTTTNTAVLSQDPQLGSGGISGAPLKTRALEVLSLIYAHAKKELIIISVGGIETYEDAWNRLCAGAHLLETYTGFIYNGPLWMHNLNNYLTQRISQEGKTHISEIIGSRPLQLHN